MNTFWKTVYRAIYLSVCLGTIVWVVLMVTIVEAPLQPNIETGTVFPFNNHGGIHYVTWLQDFLVKYLMPVNFLLMIIASEIKWRVKKEVLSGTAKDKTL